MSKQLIIPTGLVAAATEIGSLPNGKAGFFLAGNTKAVADLDTISKKDLLQIIWKKSDGTIETTPGFTMGDIQKVSKLLPSDGVIQQTDLVPVLPDVQKEGDSYLLKIIETTPGTYSMPKKTYEVINDGSGFTVESLVKAFADMIGTDMDVHVQAVDGSTKLTLKGTDPNRHFRLAVDNMLVNASINYLVKSKPTVGKAADIKALESECMPAGQGITNKVFFPVTLPDSEVKSDNYTLYVVDMELKGQNVDSANPVKFDDFVLYIAETDGAVGEELFKAFSGIIEILDDDV